VYHEDLPASILGLLSLLRIVLIPLWAVGTSAMTLDTLAGIPTAGSATTSASLNIPVYDLRASRTLSGLVARAVFTCACVGGTLALLLFLAATIDMCSAWRIDLRRKTEMMSDGYTVMVMVNM
jgi:hypothetical protein